MAIYAYRRNISYKSIGTDKLAYAVLGIVV